ncbi:MAG: rhomboid family intramembrane serine protease [Sedimentisphaerales bacterium]|nr:rhomboid family intramembrane serine protease [Sedimentisphaerales bacterium]
MLFILPYRTSIRPRKTPYANYILIAANVLIFLLSYHVYRNPLTGQPEYLRPWAAIFVLNPQPYHLHIWQFVSYAFLHGGLMHILGNMYFLYLFGNNVNDKLGNVGYMAFYLAGAVFSGLGHWALSSSPVLGASGAVAAVTGAYLVLFPQTLISVLWWFFYFINTIDISALYFIAFKLIIWDNFIEPAFTHQVAAVAYTAHIAGYAFGIGAIILMLATKLISSTHFDLWDMIRQWNRRRLFKDVVSSGFDPFSATSRFVTSKEIKKTPAQEKAEQESIQLRMQISNRITERNLPEAADIYLKLMAHDSEQVLPRQQLLDIANQLTGANRHIEASQAYEQFLKHYSTYEYAEQVELMLGLIYARYLSQPQQAIKHLQEAERKLTDPSQLKMCRDELARLQK